MLPENTIKHPSAVPWKNPLIYEAEVLNITGVEKGTIQNWMREKRFPRKLYVSRRHGMVWSRKAVEEQYGASGQESPFYL